MRDIASSLIQETYTRPDLDRRIGLLRASLEAVLYHGANIGGLSLKEAVLQAASADKADAGDLAVLDAWYEGVWKDVDGSTLPSFLSELEAQAHALLSLQLYLPVALDEESFASLASWYRREVSPFALLVVHIDPAVVGGCGFVTSDTYHEYSLRTRMKEHEGLITKLITAYV